MKSLRHTLEKFSLDADLNKLSCMMFKNWVNPPIFEESKAFFEIFPLPIYVVYNIDKTDI